MASIQNGFAAGIQIQSTDVVIDVGSGAGDVCWDAGDVGADVIAVDVDDSALAHVSNRMRGSNARSFRAVCHNCDTGPIPLPSGCASVIIAQEVTEHIENTLVFLQDLYRLGKPGARYVITVPDAASESLMKLVASPDYWKKPNHLHVFERSHLGALIERAGFEIVERDFCGFYWAIWWTLRMASGTTVLPHETEASDVPSVLRHWQNTWRALQTLPNAAELEKHLDSLIPKSQIYRAQKPISTTRFHQPFGMKSPHVAWSTFKSWLKRQALGEKSS